MRRLPISSPEIDPATIDAWSRHTGMAVSPATVRDRLSRGTLPEVFAATATRHARLPALTIGGRTVSHDEMDEMAGRAATRLRKFGLGANTRVVLIADVGLEEIAAYLGALRLGATTVLANPTLTGNEIAELAQSSHASLLVGSGAPLVSVLRTSLGDVREIAGLRRDDAAHASVQLDLDDDDASPVQPVDPDSTAILAFTSGTTGKPKPTPLSHRNILASIRGAMWAWRWAGDDHLIHSLPISHQHGLSGVHATLLAGTRATLFGRLDAESTLEAVESDSASVHFGVAAIYQRLLDRVGRRAHRLSNLRAAVTGSGPMPPDLYERYLSATGAELLERYGTTESGLDVSNLLEGPRFAGHIGLPLPGVEVAVVNDEEAAPDGMDGEVMVRGPQVFSGYVDVAASEQPFLGDWFRTGDIGVVDEQSGHLRIVGRSKEVIISGGMNVYPREIEDAIRSFPGVDDVAVTGAKSDEWGEEVVAVVAPRSLAEKELAEFLARRMAGYKQPKRIVMVDSIPRNAVGKVVAGQIAGLISSDNAAMPSGGIGSSNSKSE